MYRLKDIKGKPVLDGGGVKLGIVQDIVVTLPDYVAYLVVKGEELKKIRGRLIEYIPVPEISAINEEVTLYKNIRELGEDISVINMQELEEYSCGRICGKKVTSLDGKTLGEINEIGLGENLKKILINLKISEGETVKVEFNMVDAVKEDVKLNYNSFDLKKKISEGEFGTQK